MASRNEISISQQTLICSNLAYSIWVVHFLWLRYCSSHSSTVAYLTIAFSFSFCVMYLIEFWRPRSSKSSHQQHIQSVFMAPISTVTKLKPTSLDITTSSVRRRPYLVTITRVSSSLISGYHIIDICSLCSMSIRGRGRGAWFRQLLSQLTSRLIIRTWLGFGYLWRTPEHVLLE